MTDSGPGNQTPGVKFSVESDFQVKNKQLLRLEGKNKEKRNSKNSKKKYLLFSFSCFFLSVRRVIYTLPDEQSIQRLVQAVWKGIFGGV